MDFGSLLSVAQKNAKPTGHSSERSKFYSTKFEPPKKETKEKKLSDGIRRFLEKKEEEDRSTKEKKRKEYAELMASRTDRDKNKIKKMLKVTKSANRSVLDDAASKTDTAVTLEGPEQPDEDDYGYTSNAASALYKSLMDKYKSIPEDKKFSKSALNGSKNADLGSTKDRVRAAIEREKEDEKMGRKRMHTSTSSGGTSSSGSSSLSSDPKHRSRKNLYDPRAERDAEDRKKKEQEDERRQKMRNKRPPPPAMDFQKLLKLAEEKQHEPIQVEVPQKLKEPERLLTSKEKREIELKKKELEERERRRLGIQSKSQANGEQRKPETQTSTGRIPKLNGSNPSTSKPSTSHTALDRQKSSNSSTFKEPIRPVSSASSNKLSSKPQPGITPYKQAPAKNASAPQPNGRRPMDTKPKHQMHDSQRRPIDSKNVKPREFPPKDVVRSREFPSRDMIKTREFPPRDLKSRPFPPRDIQRSSSGMKPRQTAASKRRIIDDSDEEEYDSEMDDFIDDDDIDNDYSAEIGKIFGYDKSRYRDDEDDIDNMESSFAQQQREEFISKKIGLQEDLDDMRMEEEENRRKAMDKKRRRRQ